jgi:hypothetical protein
MDLHRRLLGLAVLLAFAAFSTPALAAPPVASEPDRPAVWADTHPPMAVPVARDSVDLEDHGGYTTEYIFGMTKGVMRSTLTPALKPVVLLLTVPLDIAFLPFAAIGGFFR